MPAKTTHIIPREHGWAVKREGSDVLVAKNGNQSAVKKPRAERVYTSQKQAIDAARRIAERSSASQIVVHGRDGSIRWREVHGLPAVQKPPQKSDLGTKAIERAVFAVIRDRL
jgi:hypothetical protein